MGTITVTEVGSLVLNMISNIPDGISGILPSLATQQVYFAENYTGNDISTLAIPETYQPAIINLTASNVLTLMEAEGIGTKNLSLGELSIGKGLVEGSSKALYDDALRKLSILGQDVNYYQTWA